METIDTHVPFGYEIGTDGKKLIENKNEQKIIRLIASLKGKGYSNNDILKSLNQKAFK